MRAAAMRYGNLKLWRQSERFRELEEESLELGKGLLFERAWSLAVEGELQPIFQGGRCVGYRRKFSERMMEMLLKAFFPAQFDRKAMHGQPVKERVILGTPEQVAEVVRRLSPTARRVEAPLPSDGNGAAA